MDKRQDAASTTVVKTLFRSSSTAGFLRGGAFAVFDDASRSSDMKRLSALHPRVEETISPIRAIRHRLSGWAQFWFTCTPVPRRIRVSISKSRRTSEKRRGISRRLANRHSACLLMAPPCATTLFADRSTIEFFTTPRSIVWAKYTDDEYLVIVYHIYYFVFMSGRGGVRSEYRLLKDFLTADYADGRGLQRLLSALFA